PARTGPPAGVCLVGLFVSPARCSQADAARAALPPCAARAAQPSTWPPLPPTSTKETQPGGAPRAGNAASGLHAQPAVAPGLRLRPATQDGPGDAQATVFIRQPSDPGRASACTRPAGLRVARG